MNSPSSKPAAWVDSHFHLFPAGQGQSSARYIPSYDAIFEDWQRGAAAAGVSRGVLVQPSFLGSDNTRLCGELARHPDALRGVAVIDAWSAPAEIHRLHAAGVRGVRLNLAGISHELQAWHSGQWDALLACGWHVELHTDVGGLPAVLGQLPGGVPVVVDHMAKPSAASAEDPTIACLRARSQSSGVHVKLSGAYRLEGRDAGAVARVLLDELGQDALLWGSDWPCTNHEEQADYPRLLDALWQWVGPEAAAAALGRNALALYWGAFDTTVSR